MPTAFTKKGPDNQDTPLNEISVDWEDWTEPQKTQDDGPGGAKLWGVGGLVAGYPRGLDFRVVHCPSPENYAHSQIEGENSMDKCDLLAEETRVIIYPDRQRR